MRHARSDYDGIQDASGKIPEDELVFVIRAQDANGPATVRDWARHTERSGGAPELVETARRWADEMQEQQNRRYAGGKVADAPPSALR